MRYLQRVYIVRRHPSFSRSVRARCPSDETNVYGKAQSYKSSTCSRQTKETMCARLPTSLGEMNSSYKSTFKACHTYLTFAVCCSFTYADGSHEAISPYFGSGLSDFDEISPDDAVRHSWVLTRSTVKKFKNTRCGAAILTNLKITIFQPWFERFRWNLAQWRSSTLSAVKNCNFTNPKIVISRQRFDRLPWNLVWWRNSTLVTRPTVRNL